MKTTWSHKGDTPGTFPQLILPRPCEQMKQDMQALAHQQFAAANKKHNVVKVTLAVPWFGAKRWQVVP